MKNNDNQCFKWAVARTLNPKQRDAQLIDKHLREKAKELNWENIEFPVSLKAIDKFEQQNPKVNVNVLGYEGYPLQISKLCIANVKLQIINYKPETVPCHFPPKSEIENRSKHEPHLEQATGHGMHCREILFTPCCSPRAREFPRSVNFSLRRTVAVLRGVKVAQFSDFVQFSPYKTPKTYLPVTSLQPRGYIAE